MKDFRTLCISGIVQAFLKQNQILTIFLTIFLTAGSETHDIAAPLCLSVKGKHERKTQRFIDNLKEGFEADKKTTYIDVLKIPLILSVEQVEEDFISLTIRSRHVDDFDYALQLKEDILKHTEQKFKTKQNVIRTVKAAIASIDFDSSDKDLALQHCYQYWRDNCSYF